MDELAGPPSSAPVPAVPPRGRGSARGERPPLVRRGRPGQRPLSRALLAPTALAAALAAVYVAVAPPSADLAAQAFRADLFAREGFTVVSTAWFGGHHTPGYSVLAPALGATLGTELTGALAAVAATFLFGLLTRSAAAAALIVPALIATLVSGRTTFALGAACGIGATLAAGRGRTALAAAGGILTALASPVAALFAGIAGAAYVLTRARARAGFALGAGAALTTLALVVAFPEGGTFPFVASSFLPVFALALAAAWLAPPRSPLRAGALLYALIALAVFVVPSPIGGNAARLGVLVAAPALILLLWPRSKVAVALLALPLAYLVVQAPARDVARAHDDPATHARFHQPLVDWLEKRGEARRVRIEVPLTQNHGEANLLARHVAIARGWERQVDRDRAALFYADDDLDPRAYLAWLRENAVTYVALPQGVPLDAAGDGEAELLRSGRAAGLREVARPRGWRVYAVDRPQPLGVDTLTPTGFTVSRSGTVRVRWSPYWAVTTGRGCVQRAPGDWTQVRVESAAPVRVTARFDPRRIRSTGVRCR